MSYLFPISSGIVKRVLHELPHGSISIVLLIQKNVVVVTSPKTINVHAIINKSASVTPDR